jgi:hypothetical protein
MVTIMVEIISNYEGRKAEVQRADVITLTLGFQCSAYTPDDARLDPRVLSTLL